MDPQLLGKIVLARFLEIPLARFNRTVIEAEALIGKLRLERWIGVGQLADARLCAGPADTDAPRSALTLGTVLDGAHGPVLAYHRESFTREYRFAEEEIGQLVARAAWPEGCAGLVSRLRLINTRNRLSHALVNAVLTAQAAYLRTGDPLRLVSLPQALISARLRADPALSVVADAGRVSRLVRALTLTLPGGRVAPLGELVPKPRQVHRHLVECIIREEKERMLQGALGAPLSDGDIAAILRREYGADLLRRTVASIRQDLAIPDSRGRRQRMAYLVATEGFSALMPLTPQILRTAVPPHPGVYEIRTTGASGAEEKAKGWISRGAKPSRAGVIYIGSSGDLRKRLGDHLRGNSDNMLLHSQIAGGAARVRYCLVNEAWRVAERRLYEVFCETFGEPPPCNRMSP